MKQQRDGFRQHARRYVAAVIGSVVTASVHADLRDHVALPYEVVTVMILFAVVWFAVWLAIGLAFRLFDRSQLNS